MLSDEKNKQTSEMLNGFLDALKAINAIINDIANKYYDYSVSDENERIRFARKSTLLMLEPLERLVNSERFWGNMPAKMHEHTNAFEQRDIKLFAELRDKNSETFKKWYCDRDTGIQTMPDDIIEEFLKEREEMARRQFDGIPKEERRNELRKIVMELEEFLARASDGSEREGRKFNG